MDFSNLKFIIRMSCLGLILSFFTTSAWAVHDTGTFELDGNAVSEAPPGDDWENVYNNTDSANVTSFKADPAPQTIFDGGKKDIQDVSDWSWKHGSVPDKDDITNAYAAAYEVDGDLVIYFGADRFSNVGDAFLGFWFFKDEVTALPNGDFSGNHTNGDVLVLVNFPQANNAVPYIAVVLWDDTCSKADSNSPMPGDCAAKNLRLELESDGTHPAECEFTGAGDFACATTNHDDETSPWPYTPKAGVPGVFPFESLYEGGINISELIGSDTCFSSFMAESRSSSSFTASLKDFVLDQFKLCGLELVKTCPIGEIQPDGLTIRYTYELEVTNTGFGALYEINATDITAGDYPNNGNTFYQAVLDANSSTTFSGYFDVDVAGTIRNYAEVTAALTVDGEVSLTAEDDVDCAPPTPAGVVYLEKDCDALVAENVAGVYGLKVKYSGQICSISDYAINNVNVVETHDGGDPIPVLINQELAPNSCIPYYGSYIPVPGDDIAPGEVITADEVRLFSDTVDATATFYLDGSPVPAIMQVNASCELCIEAPERTALDEPEPEL
ncbi:hypothetical protein [Vibrio sp. YIC-376]|uniref:hypothetical protein n=1 Tax=Vibrio sp. YIC-376 TaxID=3136162 RepID=UPI00402A90DA